MRVIVFHDWALIPRRWRKRDESPSDEYTWNSLIGVHPTWAPKCKFWTVACLVYRRVREGKVLQSLTFRLLEHLGATPINNAIGDNLHHPIRQRTPLWAKATTPIVAYCTFTIKHPPLSNSSKASIDRFKRRWRPPTSVMTSYGDKNHERDLWCNIPIQKFVPTNGELLPRRGPKRVWKGHVMHGCFLRFHTSYCTNGMLWSIYHTLLLSKRICDWKRYLWLSSRDGHKLLNSMHRTRSSLEEWTTF